MLTFIPHMGIIFSKEKKNTIFLLIISECFRFIQNFIVFKVWGIKNADCFHAWSYCCGNPLFHPLKNE